MTSHGPHEVDFQKRMLALHEVIRSHVGEEHWDIIEALIDVDEELSTAPYSPDEWSVHVWPYFVAALQKRLAHAKGEAVEDVRSTLEKMRLEILDVRLLGLFPLDTRPLFR